jgi:hypothetical protein
MAASSPRLKKSFAASCNSWCGGVMVKKPGFQGACQEYILDTKTTDTRFGQCLQGYRVFKKVVTMTCTNSAFYAIMLA